MYDDITTLSLVTPFPRQMGYKREIVNNLSEFLDWVNRNEGKEHVAFSLYNPPDFNVIDKLWFDFDSKGVGYLKAFEEVRIFYTYLISQGYLTIPVITPHWGFHIYILTLPYRAEQPKEVLLNVKTELIRRAFGRRPESLESLDTQNLSDNKRMSRLPNTRHPKNQFFCSYLPPDFYQLTVDEVLSYTRSPTNFEYEGKRLNLMDLGFEDCVKDYEPVQYEVTGYECQEIIPKFVEVKFKGNRYLMAICPFHPDTKPSLAIYPDNWHCFGCGRHGNLEDFMNLWKKLRRGGG
jgi:hypothetical protein